MIKFTKGEIVKLKSGGPDMTIIRTSFFNKNKYLCCWMEKFVSTTYKSYSWFFGEMLKKV